MFGFGLVLGLWLSWVCVEQSSFLTIFFYDFSVFDFWVCMIFFGFVLLCVLPFWDFEFLLLLLFCVFKFEFVFGSGFFLCSLCSCF